MLCDNVDGEHDKHYAIICDHESELPAKLQPDILLVKSFHVEAIHYIQIQSIATYWETLKRMWLVKILQTYIVICGCDVLIAEWDVRSADSRWKW